MVGAFLDEMDELALGLRLHTGKGTCQGWTGGVPADTEAHRCCDLRLESTAPVADCSIIQVMMTVPHRCSIGSCPCDLHRRSRRPFRRAGHVRQRRRDSRVELKPARQAFAFRASSQSPGPARRGHAIFTMMMAASAGHDANNAGVGVSGRRPKHDGGSRRTPAARLVRPRSSHLVPEGCGQIREKAVVSHATDHVFPFSHSPKGRSSTRDVSRLLRRSPSGRCRCRRGCPRARCGSTPWETGIDRGRTPGAWRRSC